MLNETSVAQIAKQMQEAFQLFLHTYDISMQRTLRKYGLYPGQPQLLLCIRSMEKPTQNEIAAQMSLSRASVGVSLRRLEQSGFVKRVRDKKDTRCIRIALTPKGAEYTHWCELDLEMIYSTMLENMDEDEKKAVIANLGRMNQSLLAYNERMDR
ncbi:MAG: MarR family winged helix-turn-helix transcriptional regulator [Eubacteriales bacterium]|nr:MarR family winged helix-turn-helix transcriptional regulator [Eubacteriales bacterium]